MLKWTQVNNMAWGSNWGSQEHLCSYAAVNGHLPALKYLHENGCPWDLDTCHYAAQYEHWDCFQYAVDNTCPGWEEYAEDYAE